jgi:hypothetical protein
MATITCRAFGVPGCLNQLNYKKPDRRMQSVFSAPARQSPRQPFQKGRPPR